MPIIYLTRTPTNNIIVFFFTKMDLNNEVLKTIIFSDFIQKLVLVHASCRYLCYILHRRQWLKRRVPPILTQSTIERQLVHDEIMHQLRTSEKCYDVIHIGPQACPDLCDILQRNGDLQDTQRAIIEEQVAKFLHILSHNVKNRTISFFFFVVSVRPLISIFIMC